VKYYTSSSEFNCGIDLQGLLSRGAKVAFQEEVLRILKKYCVQYDERYLWD
jgi:hypothetical protein